MGAKALRFPSVPLRCGKLATASQKTDEEVGGCLGVFDLHSQDFAHEYFALIPLPLIFKKNIYNIFRVNPEQSQSSV